MIKMGCGGASDNDAALLFVIIAWTGSYMQMMMPSGSDSEDAPQINAGVSLPANPASEVGHFLCLPRRYRSSLLSLTL